MNRHLSQLIDRAPSLSCCVADINRVFETLRDSFASGGKLLLCGNGGSGADCEHWAGELLKGFLSRRPAGRAIQDKLGEDLASKLQGGLPAIPLTGFLSLRTAWQNDCDNDYLYAQLVHALGRPGDVLVGISTSGNAKNVNLALETARKSGLRTVALTGEGGGFAVETAELSIRVPSRQVHFIQELHLPVYHTLCLMLEDEFFPEGVD